MIPDPTAPDPRAELRERLEAMRADLVAAMMRDGYSGGMGAMLAGIAAALDALAAVALGPAGTVGPAGELIVAIQGRLMQ